MDEYWFRSLLYRGRPIPHLGLIGSEILAQYETAHGYLIVTGNDIICEWWPEARPRTTTIALYFVLSDFSGAEWAMATVKLAWRAAPTRVDDRQQPPEYAVTDFRIVDDRHLDFRVGGTARIYWIWYPFGLIPIPPFGKPALAAKGGYRVTLSGARPTRLCFGAPEFERPNSSCLTGRYFKINRHANRRSQR